MDTLHLMVLTTIGGHDINTQGKLGIEWLSIQELNRYKIIPIKIEDLVLGYAYLENDSVFG